MKGVIMAGGYGTRLFPLTSAQPKPLIPVANKPVIEYSLDTLCRAGVNEAVITLKYMGEMIQSHLGLSYKNIKLSYSFEENPLGTAGGVKKALGNASEDTIVLSGDAVSNLDLKKLIEFHRKNKADASIALYETDSPCEYGIVSIDKEKRVTGFTEKPAWGQVFTDTVNTGIYILSPRVVNMIPDGESSDFGRNIFVKMLEKKMRLYALPLDGYWCDVGTPEAYIKANFDISGGSVIAPDVYVPIGLKLKKSVIQSGVSIGKNVSIENSIICAGAVLPDSCSISDSIFTGKELLPINPKHKRSMYETGADFSAAFKNSKIGVGGKSDNRLSFIKGLSGKGTEVWDLGDISEDTVRFSCAEYNFDYTVYISDDVSVFERSGISPSRKFMRRVRSTKSSCSPARVNDSIKPEKDYIRYLEAGLPSFSGIRFLSDNSIIEKTLINLGAKKGENGYIIKNNTLNGYDRWHLLCLVIPYSDITKIALPYTAPQILAQICKSNGIEVVKYAEHAHDDHSKKVCDAAEEFRCVNDFTLLCLRALGICATLGVPLERLMDKYASFSISEEFIGADAKSKITVMKKYGHPDGEGVLCQIGGKYVRAVAREEDKIKLTAEAYSAEAAQELIELSKKEIKNILGL